MAGRCRHERREGLYVISHGHPCFSSCAPRRSACRKIETLCAGPSFVEASGGSGLAASRSENRRSVQLAVILHTPRLRGECGCRPEAMGGNLTLGIFAGRKLSIELSPEPAPIFVQQKPAVEWPRGSNGFIPRQEKAAPIELNSLGSGKVHSLIATRLPEFPFKAANMESARNQQQYVRM